MFCSMRIVESPILAKYKLVERTWKERLFTRPWRPLQKRKQVEIENSDILFDKASGIVYASPRVAARIRAEFERQRSGGGE